MTPELATLTLSRSVRGPDFDTISSPVNWLHSDKYYDSKKAEFTLCPKKIWILTIGY